MEVLECWAEEVADARVTSREETLSIIEGTVLKVLEQVTRGQDPTLHLAELRLQSACLEKRQQAQKDLQKVLALIQRIVLEGKSLTQRDAYYTLIQHFKNQAEFNDTLQDIIALTGCARSSLGLCASSSGALAGCILWKEEGVEPVDCSTSANGKTIPGHVQGITFESLGARYILVVEKDAVFTYLCRQRVWDSLPCVLVTGCGYPPLSVRAVVKQLSIQLGLPVLGLFDYNPHGLQILLTYKLGSVRMGLEGHAYAVDIQWLGLHYQDIVDGEGQRLRVEESSLQPWSAADERVFAAVRSRVESTMSPAYCREIALMASFRRKAEIEAINSSSSSTSGGQHFDSLENSIIHKIICKKFF